MLNHSLRVSAIDRHSTAVRRYEEMADQVGKRAGTLHRLRSRTSEVAISACEAYINKLANSPKELDRSVSEFKVEYHVFSDLLRDLQEDSARRAAFSGSFAGASAVIGVGVGVVGPTAAMAIATTFGTASTGTAISALSGAAATKAAVAWLGGGAVAAGGGGIAAGKLLLALAGPVGWGIAATGVVISGVSMHSKNAKIAARATDAAIEVEAQTALLETADQEIIRLSGLTRSHAKGVREHLQSLEESATRDYRDFSEDEKLSLAALVNNVRALSQLLNYKVE